MPVPRRRDVDRLQSEIEELFADLWQVPRFAGVRHEFRPAVDAYRTEDPPRLTIVVELPGVDRADVHVDATPRTLTVTGVRRKPKVEGRLYEVMEIEHGPFRRSLRLMEDVDTEAATAAYADGLLTIVLPLAEKPARPVTVPIEVSGAP